MRTSLKQMLDQKVSMELGARLGNSKLGDGSCPAYFTSSGKEFAHFHGPNHIDIRLTKPLIRKLRSTLEGDRRATLRQSDWLDYTFLRQEDLKQCMTLLKAALDANESR